MEELRDKADKAEAYGSLAKVFLSLGDHQKAIKYYTKFLDIVKELHDKRNEGQAYGNLGNVYYVLGDYKKSIEYYTKFVDIAIELRDKINEGRVYGNLGNSYDSIGDYRKAIEYHTKHLDIALAAGEKIDEGRAHGNLGVAYQSLGDYKKAREYHAKCLDIAIETRDTRGEGCAYCNLGNVYSFLGDNQRAIEYHEKDLNIAMAIGDTSGRSLAYCNLGNVFQALGDYARAKEFHNKCLDIALEIGEKKAEGMSYGNLGNAHAALGDYHKAIVYHEKYLKISIEMGDKNGEGGAYGSLGSAHDALGDYDKAIAYHEKHLKIAIEIGDKQGEGTAYGNLGNAHCSLEKYQRAIEHYRKHLKIAIDIGDKKGKGTAYGSLGIVYYVFGEYEEAIEYNSKHLNIAAERGDKKGEGQAYGNLGNIYMALEDYPKAIEYYTKGLNIATEIGDKHNEATSHHSLAVAYSVSADRNSESHFKETMKTTIAYFYKSLSCYEFLLDHLTDQDNHKVSIVETFIKTYKLLTSALIETQRIKDALVVCERGRARSIGDILTTKYSVSLKNTLVAQMTLDDINVSLSDSNFLVCFFDFHEKNTFIWILKNEEVFFAKSEIGRVHATLESVVSAAYDAMKVRDGADCEDRSMDNLSGDAKGYGVSKEREPRKAATLSIWPNDLAEKNKDDIRRGKPDHSDFNPFELLYNVLLAPVEAAMTKEEIVVIADGPLHKVPFPALYDPSTNLYLSDTKRIRLAPSLTTLKVLQECPVDYHSKKGALIVGDPDVGTVWYRGEVTPVKPLPGAKLEADGISEILHVVPLTGKLASKDVIKEKLKQDYGVIHIAAHGDDRNGEIVLAPSADVTGRIPEEKDYILTMDEVQEIGVRAQLVVLSCCHSGRGEIKAEGVISMSRAFLAAGARAVVATLWAIDDDATLKFMKRFYSHLKEGKGASTSLQKSMIELRENEGYSDPKYWAPFFLIGDDVTLDL